jgi:hypothetical protein
VIAVWGLLLLVVTQLSQHGSSPGFGDTAVTTASFSQAARKLAYTVQQLMIMSYRVPDVHIPLSSNLLATPTAAHLSAGARPETADSVMLYIQICAQ